MPGSIRSSTTRSAARGLRELPAPVSPSAASSTSCPRGPQVGHHHLADGVVVVDHQHAGHRPPPSRRACAGARDATATTTARPAARSISHSDAVGAVQQAWASSGRAPKRPSTGTASSVTEPQHHEADHRRGARLRGGSRGSTRTRPAAPAARGRASWSTHAADQPRREVHEVAPGRGRAAARRRTAPATTPAAPSSPRTRASRVTSIRATHLVCSTPGRFGRDEPARVAVVDASAARRPARSASSVRVVVGEVAGAPC